MGRRPGFHVTRLGALALVFSLGFLTHTYKSSWLNGWGTAYADRRFDSAAILAADSLDEPSALQMRFEEIARSISSSVVAISATTTEAPEDALRAEEMNTQRLERILDRAVRTVGTGMILDTDGYILTNEHVISGCTNLWVTMDNGTVYPAVVVGSDPRADLAVLKIQARNLTPVKFADGGKVKRGQWTIALGNPYGLATAGEMAMSVGVVSATDRSLPKLASKENRLYSNLIQTTAQINPGNSGGPLFDINGEVIGVSTAVILPQKQTNGIGFALPITPRLLQTVENLKQGREVEYGYLGVMVVTPTARERRNAGVDGEIGARIESIENGSPAALSELRPDDVVVAMNGMTVRDGDHFVRLIGETSASLPAEMKVYRDGKPLTLRTTLGRREPPANAITSASQRLRWRGMLLGPIPANWTFPDGKRPNAGLMVLAVDAQGPAAKEGIVQGAVLRAVAGKSVSSILDLQRIIDETPVELCKLDVVEHQGAVVAADHSEH